jgi:photosystem II stability/assembly factor-like uncharacterized protein
MKRKPTIKKLFLLFTTVLMVAVSIGAPVWARDADTFPLYLPSIISFENEAARWIGPEGGTVNVLVASPSNSSTLYAGTAATGVFRTTDGGSKWVAANDGIKTQAILSLAIDHDDTQNIYAGTDGQGIYKSTDGGDSWAAANKGIGANAIVYALAVNPGNSALVYAGTRTKGTNNGVLYKSVDNGKNWSAVFTQTGNWVNSLAVNPNKPNLILAATQYNGPYIAKSYGSSGEWTKTTVNSGDRSLGMAVAYDPRAANNRAYFSAGNDDFFLSSDNGSNWNLSDSGIGDSVLSRNGLAIKPSNPSVLYLATNTSSNAGVLRSGNSGDSWSSSGLKGKKVYTVAAPIGSANTVFAGTYQEGVYKSTDGGATWKRSTSGLGSSYVTGMTFKGSTTYYSATYGGGVLKSTNSGQSWEEFNTNLGDIYINGLVQHPTKSNIIYALTANNGLRHYDLNTTAGWVSAQGLPAQFDRQNYAMRDDPETTLATAAVGINAMAFAPSDSNIAYLATNGGGVYASTNSGTSFSPRGLTNEVVTSVAVNQTDPDTIYVSTSTKGVVKKSTDGGTAWVSIGLPEAQLQQPVNVVAMWPGVADQVCAGTDNGIWIYNGTSWEAAGLQGRKITSLVPDLFTANFMFAGTDNGAFYSNDHHNWTPIAEDSGTLNVASINFNSAEHFYIYFGTVDHGALRVSFLR